MINPRPSVSTFAIDGGAGESVERVPLLIAAMDPPADDDHRGSPPSLTSLLCTGSCAFERYVHRYPYVTWKMCHSVAT